MELDKFLKPYISKDKSNVNYTKIPNKELGIFGQKYSIPDNKIDEFYKIYKKFTFENNKLTYLTEKQLEIGKILIDLDFRYKNTISKKCHSIDHIIDFIQLCFNGIHEIFDNILEKKISFYVFEKDNVNILDDKTKDGIHIIINVTCDVATKLIFRDYLLENIQEIWDDLPITNSWNDVIDEGVIKRDSPWQLYGSQKPGFEQYKLKYIYNLQNIDNDINMEHIDIKKIDFNKYFPYFCARNNDNTYNGIIKEKYNEKYNSYNNKTTKKKILKIKNRTKCNDVENITSSTELDSMLESLFDDKSNDYQLKEIHDYTMSLPEEYWGPGSYNKWIRVGWVLKNTNPKLVLTWFKFSSQSSDFDFHSNDVLDYWNNFDNYTYSEEGLTFRSIIYWSKISNFKEYNNIHKKTIDYYIFVSFKSNTECDLATTMYHMYKSQFVCTSIKDNIWYQFINHRWCRIDSGTTLRTKIHTEVYNQYTSKVLKYQTDMNATQNNMSVVNNNIENTIVQDESDLTDQLSTSSQSGNYNFNQEVELFNKLKEINPDFKNYINVKKKIETDVNNMNNDLHLNTRILEYRSDIFYDISRANKYIIFFYYILVLIFVILLIINGKLIFTLKNNIIYFIILIFPIILYPLIWKLMVYIYFNLIGTIKNYGPKNAFINQEYKKYNE